MYSKAFRFGGLVLVAAMIGCGSSGSGSATGGTNGSGGSKGTGGTNGTGGGSGNGTFSTSVPSTTKLNNLSSGQATQLCSDFTSYATSTLTPDFCRESGLLGALLGGGTTDAQLQAACTAAYNNCLASDGGATTTMCDPTMLASNSGSSTCTATVGDLTSCLNDSTAPLRALPTCSTLTAASLAALSMDGGSSTTPASCAPVNGCNGVSTGG